MKGHLYQHLNAMMMNSNKLSSTFIKSVKLNFDKSSGGSPIQVLLILVSEKGETNNFKSVVNQNDLFRKNDKV